MSSEDIEEKRLKIHTSTEFIKKSITNHFTEPFEPRILIICGSGLGGISNRLDANKEKLVIPYSDIPNFKKSTVPGHMGTLIFGTMNRTPVVLMNGRLHGYEGNSLFDTTFPIRVLDGLKTVQTLIVTNAAGGLNHDFQTCDLMCIYDHINFPGLAGKHPLIGENMDEYGPRFLALSDAYDLELRKLLFRKQRELGISRKLHEGTYCFVSGPTFETRAECRMINAMGGDAVGMSTVPEVIVARHCGWRVLALSLITNKSVLDHPASVFDENPVALDVGIANHAEVLENGKSASTDVEHLIAAVVGDL
ncbi:hypothetical protein TBLA_0F02380 [Henningerozyma blattae CBS 6284]|uniref:Purine nucleoside phosphorylase n=1 Tax=Henningerozyma blattae (strain ATCC 34711 / CBS 6284 / DSM 70876 / NBRC 10599 / NRRL Y-10934 / UCD 77-7) TaxID=1071380 RepID=I2H5X6_HENB6|nr:hypothetical protein TBLA_0F02380 [Tetrapisispora blattae CBS 6284]CCH61778.1 hypothetical protein TBLA_0F02380 [Tetrapisispora blattae CBS 6284]